ncbi:MAG: hypothetical protein FI707_13600 [SAR202 cluster bacterium]|mgnify:FL=1|nr:hypothetical protein [Chloroflexota bacterium]MDP6421392.1 hypothetical protein [SAR202 cluster bacterium]HAL48735.1 hypothetical protein [Dehalococcoidia bacterium]MDP6664857.1 hypothetical protein [SAR202 cluster bacterium]MDP6801184.1 hypothetical protein [SAR202 cluster bacterium]
MNGGGSSEGKGARNGEGSGSGSSKRPSGEGVDPDDESDSDSGSGTNLAKKLEDARKQTLAPWLNFAYGAIGWDELVDTDGDGVLDDQKDMTFGELIVQVETILNDPAATTDDLKRRRTWPRP